MEAKLACWIDNHTGRTPATLGLGPTVDPEKGYESASLSLSLPRWRAEGLAWYSRAELLKFTRDLRSFLETLEGEAYLLGHDEWDFHLEFRVLREETAAIVIRGQFLSSLVAEYGMDPRETLDPWLLVWGAGFGFRGLLATVDDVARWEREITDMTSQFRLEDETEQE